MKHKSLVFTALSCASVVSTMVFTRQAALKEAADTDESTVMAKMKHYIPAIVSAAAAMGFAIASHVANKKDIAMISGGAALVAKEYDRYRRKNIELNGEEAHERVMKELAVEKAKDVNLTGDCLTTRCSMGEQTDDSEEQLFYDTITEQYFTSTLPKVMAAQYHLNRNFTLGHPEVDVDMWCDFLGIENKRHDKRGWALCDDYTWIDFNNSAPTDIGDGMKAIIIECVWTPIEGYLDFDCSDEWPNG